MGPSCRRHVKAIRTKAYIDVERKAGELGLAVPDAVWIVPANFESMMSAGDAVYAADYDLVVKLLRGAGLPHSLLDSADVAYPKLVQQSFEFVALPLLIFTKHVLESHPEIIPQVLCVLLEHFKGVSRGDPRKDQHIVKCRIVKERADSYVESEYEGPIEGLKYFIEGVK